MFVSPVLSETQTVNYSNGEYCRAKSTLKRNAMLHFKKKTDFISLNDLVGDAFKINECGMMINELNRIQMGYLEFYYKRSLLCE